ncbi:hypothetical protein [Saccharopolyspora sp. NPDC002376]
MNWKPGTSPGSRAIAASSGPPTAAHSKPTDSTANAASELVTSSADASCGEVAQAAATSATAKAASRCAVNRAIGSGPGFAASPMAAMVSAMPLPVAKSPSTSSPQPADRGQRAAGQAGQVRTGLPR